MVHFLNALSALSTVVGPFRFHNVAELTVSISWALHKFFKLFILLCTFNHVNYLFPYKVVEQTWLFFGVPFFFAEFLIILSKLCIGVWLWYRLMLCEHCLEHRYNEPKYQVMNYYKEPLVLVEVEVYQMFFELVIVVVVGGNFKFGKEICDHIGWVEKSNYGEYCLGREEGEALELELLACGSWSFDEWVLRRHVLYKADAGWVLICGLGVI